MNLRIFGVGIMGGILSSLALIPPLYLSLPGYFTEEWSTSSVGLEWLGYLLAVLITFGTGYVAARWSWATSMRESVQTGLLTGLLAANLTYILIGASATSIVVSETLLGYGLRPTGSGVYWIEWIVDFLIRAMWMGLITFLITLVVGMLLGIGGGWFYAWQKAGGWGTVPHLIRTDVRLILSALHLIGVAAVVSLLTLTAFSLADSIERITPPLGVDISPLVWGPRVWSLIIADLLLLFSLGWIWYEIRMARIQPLHWLRGTLRVIGWLVLGGSAVLGISAESYLSSKEVAVHLSVIGVLATIIVLMWTTRRRPPSSLPNSIVSVTINQERRALTILIGVIVGAWCTFGLILWSLSVVYVNFLSFNSIAPYLFGKAVIDVSLVLIMLLGAFIKSWRTRRQTLVLDTWPIVSFHDWLDFVVIFATLFVIQFMNGLGSLVVSPGVLLSVFIDPKYRYGPSANDFTVETIIQYAFIAQISVALTAATYGIAIGAYLWLLFWMGRWLCNWVIAKIVGLWQRWRSRKLAVTR